MTQAAPVAGETFRTPPHRYAALPVDTGVIAASTQLSGTRGVLTYVSVAETTGAAPAQVRLIDGSGPNGQVIGRWNLAANESGRDEFGRDGLYLTRGLFVQVLAGSVEVQAGIVAV